MDRRKWTLKKSCTKESSHNPKKMNNQQNPTIFERINPFLILIALILLSLTIAYNFYVGRPFEFFDRVEHFFRSGEW